MNGSSSVAARAPEPPEVTGGALERWCALLVKAVGEPLQAVVLYGGLAKGEFVPGHSDVNVAVVLRTVTIEVLERAAPVLQQGVLEFRLAALLLTEADLRDTADVFPVKFLDMQRHHRLLWGEDPFAKVSVTREQLVVRCEQELRNLLLRLRQAYVTRRLRPELLRATLGHAVSSLLLNLGVLVELKTGQPTATKAAVLEHVSVLGLPLEPLRQAWALKGGDLRLDAAGLKTLYGAFLGVVQEAAVLAGRLG
jgi:predicted nucleotidyltransferase